MHYQIVNYFLFFLYTVSKREIFLFFWCELLKRKVIFFLNVKKILFFSCTLSKREVFFVSLMYIIEAWSVFTFLIEKWSRFCFAHLYYRNVRFFFPPCTLWKREVFLFLSCRLLKQELFFAFFWGTLSKREVVLLFLMYTIETWISFCFSYVHYRNLM